MKNAVLLCLWVSLSFPTQNQLGQGILLVAKPDLDGSSFQQTVILIVHYDRDKGAMGLALNRPSDIAVAAVHPKLSLKQKLYSGGPVQPRLLSFLLLSPDKHDLPGLGNQLYFDSDFDRLLQVLKNKKRHDQIRVFAGYAGWYPGQLELEIEQGSWLLVPAEPQWLFEQDPKKIWQSLIQRWSGTWL